MLRRHSQINPLVHSPYVQTNPEGNVAPPGSEFMITQITDEKMLTENGNYMITES
jgi:hypothetical protein